MTRAQLTELREKALAATQGPYRTEGGMDLYVFAPNGAMLAEMRGTGGGLSEEQQANNARFFAFASPATILRLLAHVEGLERKLETATQALEWYAADSIDHHNYHALMGTKLTEKAKQALARLAGSGGEESR
jgi:hypothetical protein